MAPFSLLNNVLRELKRAVDACGNRLVLIMEVVLRFVLRPCCDEPTHCINTRQLDSAGVAAGKRILHDLVDLNVRMAEYNVQYISTGDLLAGAENCTMGELMDALYSCWSKDPVHGDKIAYHRIAMGLMDILSRKVSEGDLRNSLNPKKRGRDDTPPPRGRAISPSRRRRSFDDAYRSYSGNFSGNYNRRSGSPTGCKSSYRRDY